jgi:beta-glucosidase-like glycosyl hydrolase
VREVAQLLLPSVRWDASLGFAPAMAGIARAGAAGIGGFVIEGGTSAAVGEMASVIRRHAADAPIIAVAPETLASAAWRARPPSLPPLAALASLRDTIAIRRVARIIAREAARAGCNAILAPSCDVARSAVVGAFSHDAAEVAESVGEWIDAAQSEGVLCLAGRVPGAGAIGETIDGPLMVRETDDALYARDLVPFRAAIDAGVAGLVICEAAYPSLDASGPAARSPAIVRRLLRSQLGFEGLAVADASALRAGAGSPIAIADLIAAGIDIVLRPAAMDADLRALVDALRDGRIDRERIHDAARRRRHRAEMAAAPARAPNDDEADAGWLEDVAERVVSVVRGRSVRLGAPIEIAVSAFARAAAGIVAAVASGIGESGGDSGTVRQVIEPSALTRSPLVIVFAPTRHTALDSPAAADARTETLCADARRIGREVVVIWCGHPANAPVLPSASLIIACWSQTSAMLRAAGRWLVRRV